MATITTVILTYNEEKNIEECICSFKSIADKIVILDGFSTDQTIYIAKKNGAEIIQKNCGYFERFSYGLKTLNFQTDWILFLDADERLTPASCEELKSLCNRYADTSTNGIVVNYRVEFMGRELHYGASVLHKLRVFKPETAFMEDIKLDQHIRLKEGGMIQMKTYFIHKDYKGLKAWSEKHVTYAQWAAEDYLSKKYFKENIELSGLENGAKIKRILKYKIYYRLPAGIRAWLFYVYRYYLRLGFLDGKEGKLFTYFHAYWYRFLVDAMIYERIKDGLVK